MPAIALAMKAAAVLPADAQWHHVVFSINAASLTLVSGPGPLSNVLSNVTELRILSSASPSSNGDALAGTLGVDNIAAVGDSDGDGVPDSIDQCPNTVPGASVDAVGCPPVIFGDLDRDGGPSRDTRPVVERRVPRPRGGPCRRRRRPRS